MLNCRDLRSGLRLSDRWLLDLHGIWTADPGALPAALADRLSTERALADLIEDQPVRARLVSVSLTEILHGGLDLAERLRANLPDAMRERGDVPAPEFSGAGLPRDFVSFLQTVAALPEAPARIDHLAAAVARYDSMTRVLRRKT